MSITLSNLAFSGTNTHEVPTKATSSGQRFNTTTGYGGTVFWTTTVTTAPASYMLYYEVFYWNSSRSAWQLYDRAPVTVTDSVGTHNHFVDFAAQIVNGAVNLPSGTFAIKGFIVLNAGTGASPIFGAILGEAVIYQVGNAMSVMMPKMPLPTPINDPLPHAGDVPPIDHPELPPSGPVGPGGLGTY